MPRPPIDFAVRGPHPVGVTTVQIAHPEPAGSELVTDVWYPAVTAEGREASHPLNRPHRAVEAAAPAVGAYPLIAFSHGNSGLRQQSTFLTTHLASWGFVVAAPDHPGNTFFEMIQIQTDDQRKQVHLDVRRRRPAELAAVLDSISDGGDAWPDVAGQPVGVAGHSFGGWTAMKMPARNPRVSAVCGLAPASEPFVGRKAFEPGELPFEPAQPVLIVAGVDDVLVDLDTSVRPLFERLSAPATLIGVDEADHFHFCDGVELLHGMHFENPRPNQPRPTKPYREQLPEPRVHRLLQSVVTSFFHDALVEGSSRAGDALDASALAEIDAALTPIRRHHG